MSKRIKEKPDNVVSLEGEKWESLPLDRRKAKISNYGRVKTMNQHGKWALKQHYGRVNARASIRESYGDDRTFYVAVEVLARFKATKTVPASVIYLDGDRMNCHVDNLSHVPVFAIKYDEDLVKCTNNGSFVVFMGCGSGEIVCRTDCFDTATKFNKWQVGKSEGVIVANRKIEECKGAMQVLHLCDLSNNYDDKGPRDALLAYQRRWASYFQNNDND